MNLENEMNEADRVRDAKEVFSQYEREPRRADYSVWKNNGPEVIALMISALGSIALSALRVGTILYLAELALASNYAATEFLGFIGEGAPFASFVTGLMTFEGYLFAHGFRKGKERNEVIISSWGLVVAFAVTVSAGLLSSFGLDTNDQPSTLEVIIMWIVIMTTGAGAPIIAYFGAFNLAVVTNAADLRYQEDHFSWQTKFKTWDKKNKTDIYGVAPARRKSRSSNDEPVSGSDSNLSERLRTWLAENGLDAHQIGTGTEHVYTPAQVADMLGIDQNDSDSRRNIRVYLSRMRSE